MDFEKMMRYGRHLKALMKKNFLVKIRQRKCTLAEIFLPVYAIAILVFLKPTIPNSHFPREEIPKGEIFVYDFDFHGEKVAVAPNTTDVKMFLRSLNRVHRDLPNTVHPDHKSIPIDFMYFETKEDLMAAYWRDPSSIPLAIIFENNPFEKDLRYEIKTNPLYHATPSTTEPFAPLSACRRDYNPKSLIPYAKKGKKFTNTVGCPADKYVSSGFVGLQLLVDLTKIKIESKQSPFDYPKLSIEMFPKEEYHETWVVDVKWVIPFYISMAVSQFITYLLILIVGEKEKRIKEGMKVMGVKDSVYWPAWFILYAGVVVVISVIATMMLYAVGMFEHSNSFLIFLLVMLYGLTIILFAFVLTAFFDKSRTAGLSGTFAANLPSLLYFFPKFINGFGGWSYWCVSLINSSGFALAMERALTMDFEGRGVHFHNMWDGKDISFGIGLIMMVVDIVLYAILAYYLDNVVPSIHGTKRSPFFFFNLRFWFPRTILRANEENDGNGMTSEEQNCENIEPVPDAIKGKCAIRITNLHKIFQSCNQIPIKALNGINLTIYEGQITAILGHNGAGKTTLFNILTGLTSPSEGTAHIFGMDIRNPENLETIRSMTGVCPQHEILFDTLTPREHLHFFATIRNVACTSIESEVDKTLNEIDLVVKADSPAKSLSGGQRRKLSVGIAVIGDPKIVILDEPTAGVDPYSRRQLWSLLQSKKEGKVILLTTHFMDEADILADRKAVISRGKLRCCGSSLFLKNKFGIGYHLTLVLKDKAKERMITDLVLGHLPEAVKARHHGRELSYILPLDKVNSFAPLFLDIELHINENSDLKISSYGVSMTTLEEVFLLLEKEQDDDLDEDNVTLDMMDNSNLQPMSTTDTDDARKIETSNSESANSESGNSQDMGAEQKTAYRRKRMSVDSNGKPDVAGLNFEASKIAPNYGKIFNTLVKIRVKRLIREPARLFMMFLAPIVFTNFAYYTLSYQTLKPRVGPLTLNADTYRGLDAIIALHDSSDSSMSSQLADFGFETENYDGIFRTLLSMAPRLGAVDVYSCCDLEDTDFTVLFNDTAQHSLPAIVNVMNNILYRKVLGETSNGTIWVKSFPFQSKNDGMQDFSQVSTLASFLFGAVILLLPVALCIDLVHDREMNARNQLRVSGLSSGCYYASYFTVFASIMFAVFALVIGSAYFYVLPTLDWFPQIYTIASLYILYVPASLLFVTCITFLFDKTDSAHSFMFNSFFMAGTIQASLVWALNTFPIGVRFYYQVHTLFSFVSTTYVPFAMIYSVNKVYLSCHSDLSCTHCSFLTYEIFIMFVGLGAQTGFWTYVLMKIDERQHGRGNQLTNRQISRIENQNGNFGGDASLQYEIDGDEDVKNEENRVITCSKNHGEGAPLILVQKLRKVYRETVFCTSSPQRNIVAVRNLSLAVDAGEVIGLLGHNGSGKTTTMKIITAEEAPTRGKVLVKGMNTNLNDRVVFMHIGYCPQEDAQWKNVTVREHLELYAYIRGVPKQEIPILVDSYLEGLRMMSHADKENQQCSGGTKRKLAFAIAMIGDPSIVLLDEPSTGMDPSSKRFLWDTILVSFQGKKAAILTTHSMEEADALCSRVGIMIGGRLKCIGSTQRLKNLYGAGYSLEIKLKTSEHIILSSLSERHDSMKRFVFELFSQATLEECFEERMIFSIPQAGVTSLAESFKMLEEAKRDLHIEEYSFSQTTLEQVFLRFSRAGDSNN